MPWQKIKRGLKKDDSVGDGGLTWITNILKKLRQDLLFSRQSAPPFDVALTNYYVFSPRRNQNQLQLLHQLL